MSAARQVRLIFNTIINASSDSHTKAKCRKALQELNAAETSPKPKVHAKTQSGR